LDLIPLSNGQPLGAAIDVPKQEFNEEEEKEKENIPLKKKEKKLKKDAEKDEDVLVFRMAKKLLQYGRVHRTKHLQNDSPMEVDLDIWKEKGKQPPKSLEKRPSSLRNRKGDKAALVRWTITQKKKEKIEAPLDSNGDFITVTDDEFRGIAPKKEKIIYDKLIKKDNKKINNNNNNHIDKNNDKKKVKILAGAFTITEPGFKNTEELEDDENPEKPVYGMVEIEKGDTEDVPKSNLSKEERRKLFQKMNESAINDRDPLDLLKQLKRERNIKARALRKRQRKARMDAAPRGFRSASTERTLEHNREAKRLSQMTNPRIQITAPRKKFRGLAYLKRKRLGPKIRLVSGGSWYEHKPNVTK